ncbi:alpha/beta-hydrolase [Patellaria atrata CBS 101060]|uniref:Alpha/beta-hydrolase n=1 Tax=Patellaria atrata CBS 101060 TaxID=1346257 RepID=A0A9P4S9K6_9PEZI|nr:alpha/beta-hydrolase [Patellaria atrata CBS 101060]
MARVKKAPRPRWVLSLQANFWRSLMEIGMFLHRIAPPRPPPPNFKRTIKAKVSPNPGPIVLNFYVPSDYEAQRRLKGKKYPVVVNFHGGGYTLGSASDDARWAHTVVDEVGAVVVSVDYRRAPEHPFPTAVEDGSDAVLWLAEHHRELSIDPERIAVSGFSCGGNMAFTVPLRLQGELLSESYQEEVGLAESNPIVTTGSSSMAPSKESFVTKSLPGPDGKTIIHVRKEVNIKAIVAFYPPTDYTQTREQRRTTCIRADQELSAVFTDLFDESYLYPVTMDLTNPFLSPGVAPDDMLVLLPEDIVLFCCEWDMLLHEGEQFRDRLNGLGKKVKYTMVPGVPHGWDKAPNPLRPTPGVLQHYLSACAELRRVFGTEGEAALKRRRRRSSFVA